MSDSDVQHGSSLNEGESDSYIGGRYDCSREGLNMVSSDRDLGAECDDIRRRLETFASSQHEFAMFWTTAHKGTCLALAVLSGATAIPPMLWLNSMIHKPWRMRNPRRCQFYLRYITVCITTTVMANLSLMMQHYGPTQWLDKRRRWAEHADSLAMKFDILASKARSVGSCSLGDATGSLGDATALREARKPTGLARWITWQQQTEPDSHNCRNVESESLALAVTEDFQALSKTASDVLAMRN